MLVGREKSTIEVEIGETSDRKTKVEKPSEESSKKDDVKSKDISRTS